MKINQKVWIANGRNKYLVGTIQKIYPPNESHSGRIIIHIPDKHSIHYIEAWFSEIGKSIFLEKPDNRKD